MPCTRGSLILSSIICDKCSSMSSYQNVFCILLLLRVHSISFSSRKSLTQQEYSVLHLKAAPKPRSSRSSKMFFPIFSSLPPSLLPSSFLRSFLLSFSSLPPFVLSSLPSFLFLLFLSFLLSFWFCSCQYSWAFCHKLDGVVICLSNVFILYRAPLTAELHVSQNIILRCS